MSEKKERTLTADELGEYISLNQMMSLANATVLEREADLESAKAEAKRAQAKTMKMHAGLVARLHLVAGEIVDEATGDVKPAPQPAKG